MINLLPLLDWKHVSGVENFPNTFFTNHFDYSWDLQKICENPSVSSENLLKVAKSGRLEDHESNACLEKMSLNPSISLNDIVANPGIRWNWHAVSSREDLQLSFVLKHDKLPWNWNRISANKNITWEMVEKNPDLPWCWFWLSDNPNITSEIVLSNLDKPWDFTFLSWNRTITKKTIESAPDKPWNWEILSKNSSFVCSLLSPRR